LKLTCWHEAWRTEKTKLAARSRKLKTAFNHNESMKKERKHDGWQQEEWKMKTEFNHNESMEKVRTKKHGSSNKEKEK
jgi:hypothetical protein